MRSVEEVLKNHFGSAKVMDESTAAAAAVAASSKAEGKSDATAATTVKGAYKSARENRAATLAAAEALASFPTSAASISTPGDGSDSRDQPPPLFPPAASTSAGPAWMMKGGISGNKQTIASAAKKKVAKVKYVKDPRAPKRFKSAFIFFTMHRHKTIRKEIEEKEGGPGSGERTPDVAKLVSEEWRNMAADERAKWDEKARVDRERYEVEKALYKGPWKVPANIRSKVKARQTDADAPKRPMSSFLAYSNSKRAALRMANPHLTNGDMSKMLAKMWREAPEEEKKEYIEREQELREIYLKDMAAWRERTKKEQNEIREKREEAALRFIDKRDKGIADDSDLRGEAWGDNYKVETGEEHQNDVPQHPAPTTDGSASYYAHYPPHAAHSQGYATAPPPQYYGYYYPAVVPYQYPPPEQHHASQPSAGGADEKAEPQAGTAAAAPQQPPPCYNPYMYCGPPPPLPENGNSEGASAPAPGPAAPYGHYYGYYYYGQAPQQLGAPPSMPQAQGDPQPAAEPMVEERIKVEKP